NVSFSANEWPPTDGTVSTGSLGQTSTWSISGASYGNGTYVATSAQSIHSWNTYTVFDKNLNGDSWHTSNGNTTGTLKIQFPVSMVLGSYSLYHRTTGDTNMGPKDWTIEGSNDGSTWTTIDTQTAQDMSSYGSSANGYIRTYTVSGNTTKYSYYRIVVTANNGQGNYLSIGEWKIFEPLPDNTSTIKKDGAAFATTTSNTVYIRNAGTYTAEVRGSGAYVTELSKVVSGSISGQNASNALIGSSSSAFFVVTHDGKAYSSGRNNSGQLGDGTTTNRNTFTHISSLTNVVNIDGSNDTVAACLSDGTVYAWGDNYYGQLGQGNTTNSSTPLQVKGVGGSGYLTNISAASGGHGTMFYVTSAGDLYACGLSANGELGQGNTSNSSTPLQVKGVGGTGYLTNIIRATGASKAAIALSSTGTVYTWGANGNGQAGVGNTIEYHTPQIMQDTTGSSNLTNIVKIGSTNGGFHVVLSSLASGGHVYGAGYNGYGQLGDNSTSNRSTVVQMKGVGGTGFMQNIVSIDTGGHSTIICDSSGYVYCVGYNGQGQLGQGNTTNSNTPLKVKGVGGTGYLENIIKVQCDDTSCLALSSTGKLYGWGRNNFGNLGDGTETQRTTPIEVPFTLFTSSPSVTYDGKNKLTVSGTNYADTSTVTYYSNTYNLGTAKTMYVKDAGEYVFKISGTDKYVDSNVYVSSVDLAGATTKPISFDGYNKLTLISPGTNAVSNVTLGATKYDMGSASTFYIKDTGTYDLEMSGSNVFALSSNVVNAISEPDVSGIHRFPLDSGILTDSNHGSVAFDSGATFEAPELRKDAKTSYKLSVGQNKNVTLPSALSNWCVSMWVFIPYTTSYGSSNSSNIPSDFSSHTSGGYSWKYIWTWHMANGREFRHQTHHDSHIYEYSGTSATSSSGSNMYHSWDSSIGSGSKQNWHPGNSSNNIFMPEAWHHMAWEYNGTTGKFKWYCDGIERTTAEVTMTTGCSLNGMTFGDSTPNGGISDDTSIWWYISDLVIAPSWNIDTYNLTKGTYKHFLPIPQTLGVRQLRGEGNETSTSSPSLTFDGYNKLTVSNFNSESKEWPPASFTSPSVSDGNPASINGITSTNSAKDAEWVISGASYGNGTYKASTTIAVHSTHAVHGPFQMFNKVNGSLDTKTTTTNTSGEWTIELPSSILLYKYNLHHGNAVSTSANYPKDWTIEGSNDGTTWVVIDTRSNETYASSVTGFDVSKREYTVSNNTTKYKHYKLNVSAINSGSYILIGAWRLFEKNPRTGTLTDPNGSTYALGQTQDTIYIKDTGDYTLDVTNNDQKAIVAKTVGALDSSAVTPTYGGTQELVSPFHSGGLSTTVTSSNLTGSYTPNPPTDTDVQARLASNSVNTSGLAQSVSWRNTDNTDDTKIFFTFPYWTKIDKWEIWDARRDWTFTQYHVWFGSSTTDLTKYASYSFNPTSQWDNSTPNNQTQTLSSGSEQACKVMAFSFDDLTSNPNTGQGTAGPGVARIKIWGYQSTTSTASLAPPTFLKFDGYNKLTLTDTDSDATSNIDFFSNTYEMGSRKELIINDYGTYYANIHSSNTLALAQFNPLLFSDEQKIQSSDIQAGDKFGTSVFIDGNYIIVGTKDSTGNSPKGAAYIYKRNSSTGVWGDEQKIEASDKQAGDNFGDCVS
ncbi:discoidin domain-containing protein, partial [Euryarchaeota archaeon]|nr:discoidin domain-containing protein [Euryarchaeota archaeon]